MRMVLHTHFWPAIAIEPCAAGLTAGLRSVKCAEEHGGEHWPYFTIISAQALAETNAP